MSDNFSGCKLAYIFNDELLVYKRDEFSNIPYPGLIDFPGGGREGNESPEQCVLRELKEEFSISLDESRFIYKKKVPHHSNNGFSFFFVVNGRKDEIDNISFGDEGLYWRLMPIQDYLLHPKAIPVLVSRLEGYLDKIL